MIMHFLSIIIDSLSITKKKNKWWTFELLSPLTSLILLLSFSSSSPQFSSGGIQKVLVLKYSVVVTARHELPFLIPSWPLTLTPPRPPSHHPPHTRVSKGCLLRVQWLWGVRGRWQRKEVWRKWRWPRGRRKNYEWQKKMWWIFCAYDYFVHVVNNV